MSDGRLNSPESHKATSIGSKATDELNVVTPSKAPAIGALGCSRTRERTGIYDGCVTNIEALLIATDAKSGTTQGDGT